MSNYPYQPAPRQGSKPWLPIVIIISVFAIIGLSAGIGLLTYRLLNSRQATVVDLPSVSVPEPPAPAPAPVSAGVPGRYPQGSTRLLTYSDVEFLSPDELSIMLNEIYARHHYIFKMAKYKNYFEAQPWYVGLYASMDAALQECSQLEQKNIMFLANREKELGIR